MNIAVIFAGGSGKRMNSKDKPKQFLLVHGKPIIVHTVEIFQEHKEIDGIIVVCIEDWIPYMEDMKHRYMLNKIGAIVPGGKTGQLSILNGLQAAADVYGEENTIVLIHDGVRPLISKETITGNIESVKKYGSAITCTPAIETVILMDKEGTGIHEVVERSRSKMAKAPQSFWLKDILNAQKKAIQEGYDNMIDSCTLMTHYGHKLHIVEGNNGNIKITTPEDFYTFRALYDAKENEQLK